MVGELERFTFAPSSTNALAKPKPRTFTLPSGVTLILEGFRSRCMMPSCSRVYAAFKAFAAAQSEPGLTRLGCNVSISP